MSNYYLRRGGYSFVAVCVSVCPSVCLCAKYLKKLRQDFDEISEVENRLDCGGEPDPLLLFCPKFYPRNAFSMDVRAIVYNYSTGGSTSLVKVPSAIYLFFY